MSKRRKTKTIKIGRAKIGSGHAISIQSMTKTDTRDVAATVCQIKSLEQAGCEIVRVAVKNTAGAAVLGEIKQKINIPLVADVHFNYRLALEAINAGVDAIRLNPGNIYRPEEVKAVAQAAKSRGIPIRVGVNSGSLRTANSGLKVQKLAKLMVKNALNYIRMLEKFNFKEIVISLKSSDVTTTVSAYRKMAGLCKYPLHLGITACGLPENGNIKSAIGIGSLLLEGIGDTIRVSLTGSPQEEVRVAREILQALGLRRFSPEVIACPTCGRTQVDVVKITHDIKRKLHQSGITNYRQRIAIMGCEVNGPGEAREADLGVACGKNSAVLFKKGKPVKRIKQHQIVDTLLKELHP